MNKDKSYPMSNLNKRGLKRVNEAQNTFALSAFQIQRNRKKVQISFDTVQVGLAKRCKFLVTFCDVYTT